MKSQYNLPPSLPDTITDTANCDRISPKTRGPLTERLEFALGQKFRHFIHNSEFNIKIIAHENQDAAVDVAPNDPLFLMEDNYVLCNEDNPAQIYKGARGNHLEPAFELYGEEIVPIKYIDKNGNVSTANICIRFSKVISFHPHKSV